MRVVEARDTRIALDSEGSGAPVLFVHGFPLNRSMWDTQVRALAGEATCIALDLRGFGGSAPLTGGDPRGKVLSMDEHARDLAAVLDAIGHERVHLVALSMGGYVALAFAELFPARLRSLTLVDSRSTGDDAEGRKTREGAADRLLEAGRSAFAREMIEKLVAKGAPREVRARLATMIEGTPYESIAAALMGMKERPDRSKVLESLAVPLLVVCGEEDALTPPDMSRAMAALAPEAELVLVPGAGHMSPMEKPAEVNSALRRFLAQVG